MPSRHEKDASDLQLRAITQLEKNWETNGKSLDLGIPPSPDHYRHTYLWDSWFIAIIAAYFDKPDLASMQIHATLLGQQPNGFIPNVRYNPTDRSRVLDPERFTFSNRDFGSNYTQPPLLAQAMWNTYESFTRSGKKEKGLVLLSALYNKSKHHYEYFHQTRENGNGSVLIGVIHPHETGRDSDPTFDFAKNRIIYEGGGKLEQVKRIANTILDYVSSLQINRLLQQVQWREEHARSIFWVTDVMFNCIYALNLTYMTRIAMELRQYEDAEMLNKRASSVKTEIHNRLWDKTDGWYYAQNAGIPIKTTSISNLFPLLLDSIGAHQLTYILDRIEDPEWFGTPYPLPSVPVTDVNYDPHYDEKRLWRGPVWMNMNWYIVEGLLMQHNRFQVSLPYLANRCNRLAAHIAQKSAELVSRHGCWEFYDSEVGTGMRASNFAWSTLGYVLQDMH